VVKLVLWSPKDFLFFTSDAYDSIIMSAAFGNGDVPAESIYEIVRLAKPG
jgi:hypothetical protein